MRFSSLPRLHRSTFVLIAVSLMVGVVANLGGDYHPPVSFEIQDSISFGWPSMYGQAITPDRTQYSLWNHTQINEWHFGGLLIDLVVLMLIVGAVAAIWEWRRRKIKHLLQFTLADVFLGSLLAAGFYGFERYLCRDMFTERELRLTYENPWALDIAGQKMGVAEGMDTLNQDVPADWFWELFHVPLTHRPYRRLQLILIEDKGSLQLSLKQEELLSRMRNLLKLYLPCPLSDGKAIQKLQQLKSLSVTFPNDRFLVSLPLLPKLRQLELRSGSFTDVGLLSLSRQPELRSFSILLCDVQGGTSLDSLRKLEKLRLLQASMGQEGMDAVGRMQLLNEVEFQICLPPEASSFDWSPLAKCQKLRRVLIRPQIVDWQPGKHTVISTTEYLDDFALEKISKLPNLEELLFHSDAITDAGVAHFVNVSQLRTLHVHSPDGCLTDETLLLFTENLRLRYLFFRCGGFSDEAILVFSLRHPTGIAQR